MSNLDWKTLREADFSPLKDAADAIAQYATSWDGDIEQRIKDIPILADGAGIFEGTVGDESRRQSERLESAMRDDLESGWARAGKYLEDACEGLNEKQQALFDLFAEAGVELTPAGGVGEEHFEIVQSTASDFHDTGYTSDAEKQEQRELLIQRKEICDDQFTTLMAEARDLDDECAGGLRAITSDSLGNQVPAIGEGDFEQKSAEYDAEQAAELFSGGEDGEVSQEELNRFNDTVAYWGNDPVFSTGLMNEIGAEELMGGLTDIQVLAEDGTLSSGSVSTLYEGLGNSLAVATDPSSQPHVSEEWTVDLMNAGDEAIGTSDGRTQYGYQALAPVLEHGVYDSNFIVPVADHMLALDNAGAFGSQPHPIGENANPVDSALIALDHNPTAALDFFQQEPVDLDAMGIENVQAPVDDPFEYLMEKAATTTADTPISVDAIGNAIESAATGLPSGTELKAGLEVPLHDPNQTDLVDRVMDYALEHENQFTDPDGPLNNTMDNLGDITAHYMADIHHAMSVDGHESSWLPDTHGAPLSIAEGDLDHGKAAQWLGLIAHDEQAMTTAWGTSEGLLYAEVSGASAGDNWQVDSGEAVRLHADITAALTAGALDNVGDRVDDDADEYNANVDASSKAVNFGISLIGPDPITGLAAGESVNTLANWAKVDGSELLDMTQEAQEAYQGDLRSTTQFDAMEENITTILSEDTSRDPELIADVVEEYPHAYDLVVEYYLNGEYNGMERN